VWRCGRCGLIFPNPMPIPVKGLEQHHAVDPGGVLWASWTRAKNLNGK